jgi:hypothetical protein
MKIIAVEKIYHVIVYHFFINILDAEIMFGSIKISASVAITFLASKIY